MDQNLVLTIEQEVEMMKAEMQKSPKLLQKFVGEESCCIFRVPQILLREIGKEAYQPRIVSIGPYYHGNEDLKMIQEHKWRYLDLLLEKMLDETLETKDTLLKSLLDSMVLMENEVRQSYSESIEHFHSNDLAKMMVLDGVFLIERFRKLSEFHPMNQQHQDPIFQMGWLSAHFITDFLCIGNQIPLFVLQTLFDKSRTKYDRFTLPFLILDYFNSHVVQPGNMLGRYVDLEGKHLLDFLRRSFIKKWDTVRGNETPFYERIQPATKLVVAGVKFKKNQDAESFLDIKFQNGVLWIPQINMDGISTSLILNSVLFEQCYSKCSKHMTTYLVFLGWLLSTPMDLGPFSESKIIQNYLGTDKELVKFINDLRKDVIFYVDDNYLEKEIKDIHKYCNNGGHVLWAGCKHAYLESPWTFISAFAAFVLLSLAGIQTFYTVYPYYNEQK